MNLIYWCSGWLILVILLAVAVHYLSKGGSVREKKQCHCDEEPEELIIRFPEPLVIDINVNIITPEPEVRSQLTIGPVSERKI